MSFFRDITTLSYIALCGKEDLVSGKNMLYTVTDRIGGTETDANHQSSNHTQTTAYLVGLMAGDKLVQEYGLDDE